MTFLQLILLVVPLVVAGSLNMAFIKSSALDALRRPIDGGLEFRGKKLLGDNKTWKGLLGMTFLTALCVWLYGNTLVALGAQELAPFTAEGAPLSTGAGALFGAALGLAYMLAELPNSFIKRQIGIEPGASGHGHMGRLFFVIDQGDSVLGCLILVVVLYPVALSDAGLVLAIGGGAHLAVNLAHFRLGLRRSAV